MLLNGWHVVFDGVGQPADNRPVAGMADNVAAKGGLTRRLRGQARLVPAVDEHDLMHARAGELVSGEIDRRAGVALGQGEGSLGDGAGVGVLPRLVAAARRWEAETFEIGEGGPPGVSEPCRVNRRAVALERLGLLQVAGRGLGELGHRRLRADGGIEPVVTTGLDLGGERLVARAHYPPVDEDVDVVRRQVGEHPLVVGDDDS